MAKASMAIIKEQFQPILEQFMQSATITKLLNHEVAPAYFKSVMRQIFHHTRENPQLQALATIHFRGHQREVIKRFYRHAASEIGHDQLALNDFKTLSGDATCVPYENPLPATLALLGYGFYQIYNLSYLGYLGYLFFLEFTPTSAGGSVMEALQAGGIPQEAMTFLNDHTVIDVAHTKLMESYVADMIHHGQQIDTIVAAMRTTGDLYAKMLDDAVAFVDTPYNVGWNWEELNADGLTPDDFETLMANG